MQLARMFAVLMMLPACTVSAAKREQPAVPHCPAHATVMDGWDDRAPPRKLFGNTWYVGSCGLTALLVTSPAGHVVIDGASEAAGPLIAANIRALGFKPQDVKYIVNSHEHRDHAGGIAYLQRITGAVVRVRAPALATFQSGHGDRSDPQFLDGSTVFPPVANTAVVADGETIRVGSQLALTAHATPGHAAGGTSWTWRSCAGKHCLNIAYTDSSSAISDNDFQYSAHPAYVAAFEHGLDTIAALPCDIQIAPHPLAVNLFARMQGRAPLIDANACKTYAANGRIALAARLQQEQAGAKP